MGVSFAPRAKLTAAAQAHWRPLRSTPALIPMTWPSYRSVHTAAVSIVMVIARAAKAAPPMAAIGINSSPTHSSVAGNTKSRSQRMGRRILRAGKYRCSHRADQQRRNQHAAQAADAHSRAHIDAPRAKVEHGIALAYMGRGIATAIITLNDLLRKAAQITSVVARRTAEALLPFTRTASSL